jgi:hypothetical protein
VPVEAEYWTTRRAGIALAASAVVHAALLSGSWSSSGDGSAIDPALDVRFWIEDLADREVDAPRDAAVRRASSPPENGPLTAARSDAHELADDMGSTLREGAAAPSGAATPEPAGLSEAGTAVDARVSTEGEGPAAERQPAPDVRTEPARAAPLSAQQRQRLVQQLEEAAADIVRDGASGSQRILTVAGRRYAAQLQRGAAAGDMGLEHVDVEVSTEQDGQSLQTRMRMRRLAFSQFTQLVDQWDTDVQLHDDEIRGRFHSNSAILLGWDAGATPRFLGRVTSASPQGYQVVGESEPRPRREIFAGGFRAGADRVALRRFAQATGAEATDPASAVRRFTQSADIEFLRSGGYAWRPEAPDAPTMREPAPDGPLLLAAEGAAELRVRGVVRGAVLVHSGTRIVITGNLTYARDPRQDPASDDVLGLVSDRDVVVAGPEITGPGDLQVQAAVYARRRFLVRDIDDGERAVLHVLGSLAAGSIAATEPRYATRIEYDERLDRLRPPRFPMTDRFEAETQETGWRAAHP